MVYDVLILGGGAAGYTAALYAARAGLSALVLEKAAPGGQITWAERVENYPGFPNGAEGPALGESFRQCAQRFGAETVLTEVTAVSLMEKEKRVLSKQGDFWGKTVILAMGTAPGTLGLADEERLRGRGVSYCASCDGMFFRDRVAVVVGGGNTALTDALTLSKLCREVHVVHRRDAFRGDKIYADALAKRENVTVHWNSRVTAIHGETALEGVTVEDIPSGMQRRLPCEGLFVCVGRTPNTQLVRGLIPMDEADYLLAEDTKTPIPGVFAAGDLRKKPLRQVITAAADGAVAAHLAGEYLALGQ